MTSVSGNRAKTEVYPGAVFGRLTVIKSTRKSAKHKLFWECRCECGTVKEIREDAFTSGGTVSCGCKRSNRNGLSNHSPETRATHETWRSMNERCYNPIHKSFFHYGGSGVTVCERWRDDASGFSNFIENMGIRPKDKTIDRIDGTKGYSPDNCRWATIKEQQNNIRTFVLITWRGETKTMKQWSEDERLKAINITYDALVQRRKMKTWTLEEMMTIPNLGRGRRIKA